MPMLRTLVSLAVLLSASVAASAADLTTIDRNIKKEPTYRGKPKYCLLVFGPEAKVRVWVVLDGTDLYVDRNGDGELSADERFPNDGREMKAFEIASPVTKDRYNVTAISVHRSEQEKRVYLMANVEVVGKHKQYCDLTPVENRTEAPVAHFHGPLQIGLREANWVCTEKLVRGEPPGGLNAWVGTFDRANGCWVVVYNTSDEHGKGVPADAHPVVEVSYPSAQPGGQPLRQRYELTQRC